jgi:hypothetical protein
MKKSESWGGEAKRKKAAFIKNQIHVLRKVSSFLRKLKLEDNLCTNNNAVNMRRALSHQTFSS